MNRRERRRAEARAAKLGFTFPAPDASLEEMVRCASQVASTMFNKDGEVEMFWVVDTPRGMMGVVSPVSGSGEAKDALLEKMRGVLREHDATRYVQVTEAWTAEFPLSAEVLADDEEDAPFVTDVPGSPIRVVGFRARGGKLFVEGAFEVEHAPSVEEYSEVFAAANGLEVEVVTGPEAEDLVSKMRAHMEWKAKGSGTLRDHTLRKELISFYANDGREVLMATRGIVRSADGRAYLGALSEITRPDVAGGRMTADLLPGATAAMRQ
jgi:hypothetical protein